MPPSPPESWGAFTPYRGWPVAFLKNPVFTQNPYLQPFSAPVCLVMIHHIERGHPVAVNLREAFAFAFTRLHSLSLSIHRTRIEESGLSDPVGRKSDMGVFV